MLKKKLIFSISTLICLFFQYSNAQTPGPLDKVFSVNTSGGPKFSECGLITRVSPNLTENISPSCFQSVYNLYYDSDMSLDRRGGYSAYNINPCQDSKSVKGLWPFNSTDGTKYLVIFSSNSMFSSKADGSCSIINPNGTGYWGLSSGVEMQCVQSQGYLWCGDGVDQPFRTNVVSSQSISGAPIGPLMGVFRNRILIGKVGGNLTQLYLSGELNGLDWTIPSVQSSTSPAVIGISGVNDGLQMNCLMGEFQNQYYIGRDYDLYALSGYDLRDFTIRKVSNQIGCIEPKSVQELNNQLIWLSKRGVESLTGTQITPISYYIRPTIAQIISASGNTQSKLLTSEADWESGTLCASGPNSCINSTISPGDLVTSTWTVTENSSSTFAGGTLVSVSTNVLNFVSIVRNGAITFTNAGAELGQSVSTGPTNWVMSAPQTIELFRAANTSTLNSCATSISPKFGSFAWKEGSTNSNPYNATIQIYDQTGTTVLVSTVQVIFSHMGWIEHDIILSTQTTNSMVKIKISAPVSDGTVVAFSTPVVTGNEIQLWFNQCDSGNGNIGTVFDMDESISQPTSGSYTSACYDTSISTPTWGDFNVTLSSNAQSTLTFQTQVAASCGGSFDAAVTATPGQKIASAQKEAIKYIANFTLNSSTNTPALFTNANLTAATTGYYITPAILVSTPTTWGAFQVDAVTNGGSFTFWISTGATPSIATSTTANWTLQPANSQIVVTTATAYIAARVLFSIDVATEMPTLNDMTFNWNVGNARPPTASVQYNDRYYLFYTTNTIGTAVNDHAAVYDFNNRWTLLDDINAYSATIYLNQPYVGDSNQTGTIYQLESGQSDNTKSFNYSFQTGDLSFGDPAQLKDFKRLYLFVNAPANSNQNLSITCNYSLDGDNGNYPLNSFSLSNTSGVGYTVVKFPFPTSFPTAGHWVNFACTSLSNTGPIKVYGYQMVWSPSTWD